MSDFVLRDLTRTLSLPASRHAQLVKLAEQRGMTLVDLLGEFVEQAIERGELPDSTPGFDIGTTPWNTVQIAVDGGAKGIRSVTLDPGSAVEAANLINRFTTTGRGMRLLNLDSPSMDVIHVTRRGPGVVLAFPNNDFEVIMAVSVAKDIARQLRKAAETARAGQAATAE